MKNCPFCGANIDDSAQFCLYCMQSLTEKEQIFPRKKKNTLWWLIPVAIILLSIPVALLLTGIQTTSETGETIPSTTQPTEGTITPAGSEPETQPTDDTVPPITQPSGFTNPPITVTPDSPTANNTAPDTQQSGASGTPSGTEPQTQPTEDTRPPVTQPTENTIPPVVPPTENTIPSVVPPTESPTTPVVTEPDHIHSYTERITAVEYLMSEATCSAPANYYYSCLCGKAGTETFSYGNKAEHTIVTISGYPAGCLTPGLSDGTQCSVCKKSFLWQREISPKGHIFNAKASHPTCLTCGESSTVTIDFPEFPIVQNAIRIDGCITYTLRPYHNIKWEILFTFSWTNLSSEIVGYAPRIYLSGAETGTTILSSLQPHESGTFQLECCVYDPNGTYRLIPE